MAEDGGRIVGHLAVWLFAQRFGGLSVLTGGGGDHVRRRLALRDLLALPAPPDDVVLRPCFDDIAALAALFAGPSPFLRDSF